MNRGYAVTPRFAWNLWNGAVLKFGDATWILLWLIRRDWRSVDQSAA
jgi:hypothetical protein